jgi:hypothetical protein
MNTEGQQILRCLEAVAEERRQRATDPELAVRVPAVKKWQHGRFETTYADALASPRYGDAARFFLEDLYGPTDFTRRDQQFARIVPGLVRLFPHEIVVTVAALAELHALSEQFDTAMARAASGRRIDAAVYGQAWRAVGQPAARERQIQLMLQVGGALERYTRMPLLRQTLRLMRSPARALGLEALQAFLERGFDTFKAMGGARDFLDMIAERERDLAARLFAGEDVAIATALQSGGAGD